MFAISCCGSAVILPGLAIAVTNLCKMLSRIYAASGVIDMNQENHVEWCTICWHGDTRIRRRGPTSIEDSVINFTASQPKASKTGANV